MPVMGVGRHPAVDEARASRRASGPGVSSSPQSPKVAVLRVSIISWTRRARAALVVPSAISGAPALCRAARSAPEAKMPGPGKFLLVHRDAADDLLEIFAEENAGEEALDLGEAVGLGELPREGGNAFQRLAIGGEPGKAVQRMLLALERRRVDAAASFHPVGEGVARLRRPDRRRPPPPCRDGPGSSRHSLLAGAGASPPMRHTSTHSSWRTG